MDCGATIVAALVWWTFGHFGELETIENNKNWLCLARNRMALALNHGFYVCPCRHARMHSSYCAVIQLARGMRF